MIVTERRGGRRSPWPVRDLQLHFGHEALHELRPLDVSETGARVVSPVDVRSVRVGALCRLSGMSVEGEFSVACQIMRRGLPPAGMSGVEIGIEFLQDAPPLR